MAAPSVTFDGTRVSAAENLTDGGTWDEWDSGKSPSEEPDFFYQKGTGVNGSAISLKVGTSEAGVELENASPTVDYAGGGAGGADRVVLFKTIATNFAVLNAKGATGMVHYIGSGTTTNRYNYYTHGNDDYPLAGGFVFDLIDPNIAAYRDATDGTPNLNAVSYYAVSATFSASSKAENVAMDAIDYFDVGSGLTLIGGDGVSTDANFSNFVTFDEGTAANRYGIVRTVEGILYVLGYLSIGTSANETDFTDEGGGTMVFPDSRFGPGTVGVSWNIENANSVHSTAGWSFVGRGSTTDADSRPDYDVTGAGVNASATFDGCTWRTFRNWTMNAKATYDLCTFADGLLITHNGAVISNSTFSGSTAGDGAAYLTTADPSDITDSTFIFNDGHAIVITTAGTYDIDGLTFSGYGANDTTDAAIYNNSGGAVTLNSINGSTGITVRNGTGASTTVNNSVNVSIGGVTRGTPVKVIANETVGTVTSGDLLSQGFADNTGVYSFSQNYEGAFDPSGLDVKVSARNQGVATAAIAEDNGTGFTDETSEGSSNTTADMTLLPTTPAADDAYYFGHQEPFTRLKLDVSTALVQSAQHKIVWEYWNGTAWVALRSATTLEDDFERTAIGPNWESGPGWYEAPTIVSGALRDPNASSPSAGLRRTAETYSADQWSEVTVKTLNNVSGSRPLIYPVVRMGTPTATSYYLRSWNNGTNNADIQIWRFDGVSTFTDMGSVYNPGRELVSGDRLRLEAVGTTLRGYLNDVLIATVTDSTYTSGQPGCALISGTAATDVELEGWSGGEMVTQDSADDGTDGFETSGANIVQWGLPVDWATTSVTNQANTGALYYVRARLQVVGTITTTPVGRKVTLDVSRYLPYDRERVISSTGLQDVATWTPDTISKFDPTD